MQRSNRAPVDGLDVAPCVASAGERMRGTFAGELERCPRRLTRLARQIVQAIANAFDRLNVAAVQNGAALRYQIW